MTIQLAANLSMLYGQYPFLERFAQAAADGFQGVEYLFPYDFPATHIKEQLQAHGLQQVLFNAPPGNWAAGERGLACLPDRVDEFQAGFQQALAYAQVLDCPRIHVMAGVAPQHVPANQLQDVYERNIAWAAELAAAHNVMVLIEPISTRAMLGYFLNYQAQAHAIVQKIGRPNLKVQMDLFHCQLMEGDVVHKLRQYLPTGQIGHFQIASAPDRHEPHLGELHYAYVLTELLQLAQQHHWQGWLGCEYLPAADTSQGVQAMRAAWLKHNLVLG